MVKDIYPVNNNDFYFELTSSGGALLFRADDGLGGHSLWKSDGTAEGTKDILPILFNKTITSPSWFHDVDGTLFFAQYNELWKSDGTLAGTVLVKEIDRYPLPEVALSSFTDVDGVLYFLSSGPNGVELWRSTGTTGGTTLVKK
jgi:ELWxxDGT repeat protein